MENIVDDGNVLLLDEVQATTMNDQECIETQRLMTDFVQSYFNKDDNQTTENWLTAKLQAELPGKTNEEVLAISTEIIDTLKADEQQKESLSSAVEKGRSKESWFANEAKKATSALSNLEAAKYLSKLDNAVANANEALFDTITTQNCDINMNPSLDGYIAEQYHAQTFNMNAESTGSQYRAKVLEPEGSTYTKNSVDIVIVDKDGKIVKKYQSKYCKDSKSTEKAFENGDYKGQQKLVPEEQQNDISKKSSTVLEAPDGTKSNPLTKTKAEQMRDEAQSGNWQELNWDEYALKDLSVGIAKQAGIAAIVASAISSGIYMAKKIFTGEEIECGEMIEEALSSGADVGIKAAISGAIKVAAEKGIIGIIPKGTPASLIANIVFVAVENVKTLKDIAVGNLTIKEGIEKLEHTTISVTAGLITMGASATLIGGAVGTIFGPIGAAMGGFIGGTIGFMAGSGFGSLVVKAYQKTREYVVQKVQLIIEKKRQIGNIIRDGIRNIVHELGAIFN